MTNTKFRRLQEKDFTIKTFKDKNRFDYLHNGFLIRIEELSMHGKIRYCVLWKKQKSSHFNEQRITDKWWEATIIATSFRSKINKLLKSI